MRSLQGFQLAGPELLDPSDIDVLLGADVYGEVIHSEDRRGGPHDLVAKLTNFSALDLGLSQVISSHASVEHNDLRDILVRFIVVVTTVAVVVAEEEEVPITTASDLTPEEAEWENYFQQTHSSDNSGRSVIHLPFISAPKELDESYTTADACLNHLIWWVFRDEIYHKLYSEFLTDYGSLNHMV